jgi:BirA family biotin operon repressor/biotin-[acetyl-CoA-carboxylase] ligase
MYTKEELIHGLHTSVIGRKFFLFDTIDSTNACARTLGDAGTDEGAVVLADFQTNGRGRLGRTWIADQGDNILCSILLRPHIPIAQAGLLTLFASIAIAHAVENHISEQVECKWPNDLLLHGKKFCGILLENLFQQSEVVYAVVGAGINVNQRSFPEEISLRGTSLALESGRSFDRLELLQSVLREMDRLYPSVKLGQFDSMTTEWVKRCTMFGKPVTAEHDGQTITGIARRLNDDAGLVIETDSGFLTVYAGDVTLVA